MTEKEDAIAWLQDDLKDLLMEETTTDRFQLETVILRARAYALAIEALGES